MLLGILLLSAHLPEPSPNPEEVNAILKALEKTSVTVDEEYRYRYHYIRYALWKVGQSDSPSAPYGEVEEYKVTIIMEDLVLKYVGVRLSYTFWGCIEDRFFDLIFYLKDGRPCFVVVENNSEWKQISFTGDSSFFMAELNSEYQVENRNRYKLEMSVSPVWEKREPSKFIHLDPIFRQLAKMIADDGLDAFEMWIKLYLKYPPTELPVTTVYEDSK